VISFESLNLKVFPSGTWSQLKSFESIILSGNILTRIDNNM